MISRKHIVYKEETPIYGTDIGVSIRSKWKDLPPILHRFRQLDLSVHKAKYWNDWTTMYLKAPKTKTRPVLLTDVFHDECVYVDNMPLYHQKLPYNTCIYIYNISTLPYTILDFGCIDRTGLFCEILEILAGFDIEVTSAYINTIGTAVSNIFYITYRGRKLDDSYINFIRNNLEFEMHAPDANSY